MVNLSVFEIKELISKYQSELRKVNFERGRIEGALRELNNTMKALPVTDDVVEAVSTRSQQVSLVPPITNQSLATEKTIHELVNRKSKKRPSKGYRISDWDRVLLESLAKSNDSVPIWILLEIFMRRNEEHNLGNTPEQVRGKLSRSLNKLTHKRKVIVKVPYEGKGYAYKLTNELKTTPIDEFV